MKTQNGYLWKYFLGLSLLVTVGVAAPLFAQYGATMVAKIPFEFGVGDRTLPAGEYIVNIVRPIASGSEAIQIQSKNRPGPNVLTRTMSVGGGRVRQADPQLLFHRYGDTYFLSQVWQPERTTGQQVFRSKLERELAQGNARPQVASVTARSR